MILQFDTMKLIEIYLPEGVSRVYGNGIQLIATPSDLYDYPKEAKKLVLQQLPNSVVQDVLRDGYFRRDIEKIVRESGLKP